MPQPEVHNAARRGIKLGRRGERAHIVDFLRRCAAFHAREGNQPEAEALAKVAQDIQDARHRRSG